MKEEPISLRFTKSMFYRETRFVILLIKSKNRLIYIPCRSIRQTATECRNIVGYNSCRIAQATQLLTGFYLLCRLNRSIMTMLSISLKNL